MTTDGYNGWSNYETWAVSLWIDNEDWSQHEARELVGAAWCRNSEHPRVEAADALRMWVSEDGNPLIEAASMYSDLLGHALGQVDWFEIVDSLQSDAA